MHSDVLVKQKVRIIWSYICYVVTSFIEALESVLLGIEGHGLVLDCSGLNQYGLFAIFKLG